MRFCFFLFVLSFSLAGSNCSSLAAQESLSIEHRIAAIEQGRFLAWPANNGLWQWGDELLVGFTQGDFVVKRGHNIDGRQLSLLSRSRDGGQSWTAFDPLNLLDDLQGNQKYLGNGKTALGKPLDLTHPGFGWRFFATGYHGNDDPVGGFFYTYDRGHSWHGPHTLTGLTDQEQMRNTIFVQRTDYLVQSRLHAFIFLTVDDTATQNRRVACIQTQDGGQRFEFVSWVTPPFSNARGTMSQTVQLSDDLFLSAYRKIQLNSSEKSSIELARSVDRCQSWQAISTVKVMQTSSNPPALVKMSDGRLCCAYGDRHTGEIRARYSQDGGVKWGPESIIRDDFQSVAEDPDKGTQLNADIGYVRLAQRRDGKLIAIYYWANAQNPQQHIAVSIWSP